jgi:hypothetical protein
MKNQQLAIKRSEGKKPRSKVATGNANILAPIAVPATNAVALKKSQEEALEEAIAAVSDEFIKNN